MDAACKFGPPNGSGFNAATRAFIFLRPFMGCVSNGVVTTPMAPLCLPRDPRVRVPSTRAARMERGGRLG